MTIYTLIYLKCWISLSNNKVTFTETSVCNFHNQVNGIIGIEPSNRNTDCLRFCLYISTQNHLQPYSVISRYILSSYCMENFSHKANKMALPPQEWKTIYNPKSLALVNSRSTTARWNISPCSNKRNRHDILSKQLQRRERKRTTVIKSLQVVWLATLHK